MDYPNETRGCRREGRERGWFGRRFARDETEPREGGRHGGHRGMHRHHGRHGGSARMFDQGDLRFVMLHLIAEKPRHGYELIKEIEDRMGGSYVPSPGVVYPTLTWLEELGYAAIEPGEGARKLYAITEEGRAFLAGNRSQLDAILGRMAEMAAARSSFQAAPIVRAMENLKLALRMRTSRGALSEVELDTIATALDGAARAIERA